MEQQPEFQGFATPAAEAQTVDPDGRIRIKIDPVYSRSNQAADMSAIFRTAPEDEFDADAEHEKYEVAENLRSIGVEPFPDVINVRPGIELTEDDLGLEPGDMQASSGMDLSTVPGDMGQAMFVGMNQGATEIMDSAALIAGLPVEAAKGVINLGLDAVGMEPIKSAFGDIDTMKSVVGGYTNLVNAAVPIPDSVKDWAMQPYDNEMLGELTEGITQFTVAAFPAAKMVKAMTTANPIARGFMWGAIADFTAFNPDDPTIIAGIADYLIDAPAEERGPVLQILMAQIEKYEDDSELMKRSKQALDGAILGVAAEGVFFIVKTAIKQAQKIPFKQIIDNAGQAADARIAERATDTSVTLGAGVDPMPAIDAILSAAGKMLKRDDLINATGDVVVGDVVTFKQDVFGGSFKNPKKIGERVITGEVVKDSYGAAKQQHTFTIKPIDVTGDDAAEIMNKETFLIKGRNLYRNGTMRQRRADESTRKAALDEKHKRGDAARAARDIRKGDAPIISPSVSKELVELNVGDTVTPQSPQLNAQFGTGVIKEIGQGGDGDLITVEFADGTQKKMRGGFVTKIQQANPNRISTRLPTAVKSTEDPVNEPLQIGLEEIKADPKIFEHNVGIVRAYPNMTEAEATLPTEEASEAFINHAKNNLLFVFDQVPEQTRQRSKLWYKGANAIANRLADKYNIPDSSASGVLAALSPQKDWYMNVSLGERTIDILASQRDTKFTKEMMEYKGGWLKESMLDSIAGKTLGELELPAEKAIWLRIYDEVYSDRSHRIVSPEGDFLDIATNADGKPKGTGWGSISEIAKAVSAFESGGGKEILTPLMGTKHKVRSFYNNILDPDGPNGDVTIDTHAVAAALLRPLSGQSTEVHHNFGSAPMIAKRKPDWKGAAKNSAVTGVQGNYGLYAEAYRRAAAERGVLPREMQSITWEAVRGLFTDTFKSQAKNVDGINKIWYDYRSGKVSLDEARSAVTEQAGGINPPSWQ